ncbi:hypothetical protein D1007_30538 [Hordeum vulgare]|nr:hypothetical protein D1007_30538 [Hordeum vulgare]
MTTPPPSPTADANSAAAAAAAELPAGSIVETRPRAPASDEPTTPPLAAIPPNPTLPASSSNSPASLPTTVTGVVDFKLALDGTNFQRWRNYITLLLARYHAKDHVQAASVRRLDDPAWRDDDNIVVLWFFTTVEGDLLDIVAPAGSTAYTIWTQIHDYFLTNEAEHAMHLGQEFRATLRSFSPRCLFPPSSRLGPGSSSPNSPWTGVPAPRALRSSLSSLTRAARIVPALVAVGAAVTAAVTAPLTVEAGVVASSAPTALSVATAGAGAVAAVATFLLVAVPARHPGWATSCP